MSRELVSYPLARNVLNKLSQAGFTTAEDIKGLKPSELSQESGLTAEESLEILDVVFPPVAKISKSIFNARALDILTEEKSFTPITTSCSALDKVLDGGIPLRKVTEICGCPGSGKTQLGLQLCTNVQIPRSLGGQDGEALFIDTEGSFVVQRLVEIARFSANGYASRSEASDDVKSYTVEKILKGVHYYCCKSYTEVIARINILPEFLTQNKKISLIVIDSIAFHFRYGFDGSYALRSRLLNGLLQTLVKVANDHKVAVVLTNHMTTKINEDGSSALIPALGESWGHACTIRIILSWNEDVRQAHLLKSPSMAEAKVAYCIVKEGFRDAPKSYQ